jgi:hypothetical protein
MNKNAFVEITKLYFYEEVVDLLPIKMVRSIDSSPPRLFRSRLTGSVHRI